MNTTEKSHSIGLLSFEIVDKYETKINQAQNLNPKDILHFDDHFLNPVGIRIPNIQVLKTFE